MRSTLLNAVVRFLQVPLEGDLLPEEEEAGKVSISWRGDGKYLVISAAERNGDKPMRRVSGKHCGPP
jgi:hypothetical protein